MIMIVISFVLVKFYAFTILYVLIVMQLKLVVVVEICSQLLMLRKKKSKLSRFFFCGPVVHYAVQS